jgi:predicted enzyme related to lactoylglutathione lyase
VDEETTAPLFKRVDCLSIPVSDLDAALAFYSTKLGHELIWRSNTAAGLKLPGSNAELVLHTGDRPMETDLTVDSVPDALMRFTSAGGKILSGPFQIQIGRCALVADPWSNVLVILDASKGTLQVDENKRVIEEKRVESIELLSTREGYDRWATIYDDEVNPLIMLEEQHLPGLLGDVRGLDVVDLGCGTGRHSVRLVAAGARVTAVDFRDGMVARARRKPRWEQVQFILHDLTRQLPFADCSFDRVLSCLCSIIWVN